MGGSLLLGGFSRSHLSRQSETYRNLGLKFFRRTLAQKRLKAPLPDGISGGSGQLGVTANRAQFFDRPILADQSGKNHRALNMLFAGSVWILRFHSQYEIFIRNFRGDC